MQMKYDFAQIRKTTAWRILGSAKFAIGILIFFAVLMIAGTLVESRGGTALAAQLVYGSLWFYLVQFLILISLVVAVLDRLPFRRKLIGFYTVHFSLVIIFIGSFVTRAVGIDGDMRLSTNTASQTIRLPEELIYLKLNQREYQVPWPTLWTSLLGGGKGVLVEDQGVRFSMVKVLPRAQSEIIWSSDLVPGAQSQWAGEWILKNERLSERLMLAFPGGNLVPNSTQMGPLEIKIVSWPQFQLETS
ncbi:MAG TPA: hypothetical protein PLU50_04440, partial [Pseudobdellovibrionaceae bacterium]|nr:hypothetical protein [Pseudobdellovibrionaceae bacterium]